MERLTFEGNFCDIAQCEGEYRMTSACADGACSQRKVWERLKAYENTGLEPEEISSAFNEAAITKLMARYLGTTPERLVELVQADKEDLALVLPCKVGDTLHDIYEAKSNGEGDILELKVLEIHIDIDNRKRPWFLINGYLFSFEDFGKTVFLTREEAERALVGGGTDG